MDVTGEREDRLDELFVPPHFFDDIVSDHLRPRPSLVFGGRGEGKTTVCRMVAQRLRGKDPPPLVVEATDFSEWGGPEFDEGELTLDHHVRRVLKACVEQLLAELEGKAHRRHYRDHLRALERPSLDRLEEFVIRYLTDMTRRSRTARLDRLWSMVSPAIDEKHLQVRDEAAHRRSLMRLPPSAGVKLGSMIRSSSRRARTYLRLIRFELESEEEKGGVVGKLVPFLKLLVPKTAGGDDFEAASSQQVFEWFLSLASELGFPAVYVLIDKVDEIHGLSGKADRIATLFRPLLESSRFLETPDAGMMLFIPAESRWDLRDIRVDRFRVAVIEWDDEGLKKLLRARVRTYTGGMHESLEHVFDDYPSFEPKMLHSTAYAPRNMLRILDQVVREHCRAGAHTPRISPQIASLGLERFDHDRGQENDAKDWRTRKDAWELAMKSKAKTE